MYEAKMRSGTK